MIKIIQKITIINTVPINGGDEALLCATLLGLKEYFDKPVIKVLCNDPELYKQYIDYVDLDWDWQFAFRASDINENSNLYSLKNKIRTVLQSFFKISYHSVFSRLLSSKREKRVFKILKESDIIILGAGGYIHDFYGYDKRLETLKFIKHKIKKPYYFFAQSIGPFWKTENYPKLNEAFDNAEKIILREPLSLNHLKSINYHCNNVIVNNDVAFYLYYDHALKVRPKTKIQNVAINFREWEFEKENEQTLIKAKKTCENLIRNGLKLTFVSTCQGVTGYRDDSKLALEIVSQLSKEEQKSCTILRDKYSLNQLITLLNKQDAYIGMRLHGAILSLIAGIPALNIGYEDKTIGIFNSIGLKDYCFSFKEDIVDWNRKVDGFIDNYRSYSNDIERIRQKAAEEAKRNFEILLPVNN